MFQELVNDTAARFNLSTTSVWALLRGLLSTITDERSGGAEGFVNLFRGAGLGDVLTSWFGGMPGMPISSPQLESAIGKDTLDKLANSSGLTREAATSSLTFLLPKVIGLLTPQGFLPSNRDLLSKVAGFVGSPEPPPIEPKRQSWPTWLPWAAVALIVVGGVLWARGPAGTIDPQVTVRNTEGKVTYSGVVRDRPTRTGIVNSLHAMFGEANVEGDIRVDRNVKRAPALAQLGDVLPELKTPGVVFSMNGDTITIGGWVSAAERQMLADKLRRLFGPRVSIGSSGDPAVEAVRAANDKALAALSAVEASPASANKLAEAMNLAVINFSSGSAEIPPENMALIRKCAEAIQQAQPRAILEIGGHTDNTGDSASNLALSQARAEAVKKALVAAGVAAAMLTTRGYGDTNPRAPNDSEYGRFQNRRIEYIVVSRLPLPQSPIVSDQRRHITLRWRHCPLSLARPGFPW